MPRSFIPKLITRFHRARLRTQLLLAINLSVAIVMAGFLYFDYQQGLQSRLSEKTIALSEESRTIQAAVQELKALGADAVQRHINTICSTMTSRESPGHTIQVTLGDVVLTADPSSHGHEQSTPWSELVSGSASSGEIQVRVGEQRQPVIAAARHAELARIGALTVAAFFGAIILNILLVHLVTRPLERTARAVREVGSGKLGTTVHINANRELSDLADDVSRMSRELAGRDAERHAQFDRARRLQSHLLPRTASHHGAGIAIEYHPADEIAGDFVDVIDCPNGDTLLCVADVVGHGIHAAMGSAVLKALLLATDLNEPSPAAMIESINRRYFLTSLPEDFASMILLRVSSDAKHAIYASAGHELGYRRSAQASCMEISSTGLILGVDEQAPYTDVKLQLDHGDLLVLLSDGITESANSQGKLFGRRTVASVVELSKQPDAASLARELVAAATQHRGDAPLLDDMTVLVLAVSHSKADMKAPQCTT